MQILTIEHDDFELIVECNNLHTAFQKARSKQSDIFTSTSYVASDARISLLNPDTNQLDGLTGTVAHPVFFENKDYFVGVTFKNEKSVKRASVHSKLREVQDKFYFRSEIGFLAGTINFGNDLGRSDLILRYEVGPTTREFALNFEVFPTKLDYRHDFDRIVADIEKEYPYLVLDFLKKTYSAFKTGMSPNTDLIWWQVFGGLYKEFIHASRFILNKPHSRIVNKSRYVTADRLVHWTNALEEQFAEFKHLPNHRYFSEYKTLSTDTPENRFFKLAVTKTVRRYKRVKVYITSTFANQISDDFGVEMEDIRKQLDVISNNPFFKNISAFTGIRQESLVLYKASGYSNIYRCWVMLNSGLEFLDGIQKIELKNIADLYQIWCFLEIKGILQKLLGKDKPDDVKIAEIQIDDFVFRIEKGAKSCVSFTQPNGDLVDLFHDFSYDKGANREVRSYTVNQRPDIVLRITKNDLRDNYVLTYLYDAKYRLQSDDNPTAPDFPPDDGINQMHRYRDAIYYLNKAKNKPEKEVIGAYILFPGSGDVEQIQNADYFRSIEHVNIGAFPLRPNDDHNRVLLEQHLSSILGIDTETSLREIAPQKLNTYEAVNPDVLIGIVPDLEHARCFLDVESPFYYTGPRKPRDFGTRNIRIFAPYISKKGISEYYEIIGFEFTARNEIFPHGHSLFKADDSSERLVLRLGKKVLLSKDGDFYKLADSTIWTYRYTRLSFLRQPVNNKITTTKMSS